MSENERNDTMRAQITTFREKAKLCQASYSGPLAEKMITLLKGKDGKHIDTVYAMRQYIKHLSSKSQNDPPAVYAVWYLNNLQYLKELKKNFDERIYTPLSKLYQTQQTSGGLGSNSGTKLSLRDSTQSSIRAPSAASVLKFKDDLPEVKDLYDFTEIDNISSRLTYLRQRWQHLLEDEREITTALFSYNSMAQLTPRCPKEIVTLLRLVPDILLKCNNAAALALQWLDCASTKTTDLHTKCNKLERVKSVLTERLTGLSDEIRSEERELEYESSDLEMLADREERANEIMSKTHQIDTKLQQIQTEIHSLTLQCDELEIKQAEAVNSATQQNVRQDKQRLELKIQKLHQEIDLNLYQRDLLKEDLAIELEVKPCMIRYTDHVQEKCETLEQTIDKKRSEKHRVESALIPVIADTKRTQAEISQGSSAVSTPQHSTLSELGSEARLSSNTASHKTVHKTLLMNH